MDEIFNQLQIAIDKLLNQSWWNKLKGIDSGLIIDFYEKYRRASQQYEFNVKERNPKYLNILQQAIRCSDKFPEK